MLKICVEKLGDLFDALAKEQALYIPSDNENSGASFKEYTSGMKLTEQLKAVHDGLYAKAAERRANMTFDAHNLEEIKNIADNKPGFIRAMWCGDRECEDKLKDYAGVTSRCIPFEQEKLDVKCVCCGKKAKHMLYWGKAY